MFVIRYAQSAPIHPRPHAPTVGQWSSREAAEDALASRNESALEPGLLEVVER